MESSRFGQAPAGYHAAEGCRWLHDHASACMNTQVNPSRQAALWDGRFESPAADAALALSGSLEIDLPLAEHDVAASARPRRPSCAGSSCSGRPTRIGSTPRSRTSRGGSPTGSFAWRPEHEDIHMNVEAAVIEAVGPELGGMLQAGRSRNEEIVTDERRWLAAATAADLIGGVRGLQSRPAGPRRERGRNHPSCAHPHAAGAAGPAGAPPARVRRDARPRCRPPGRCRGTGRPVARRLGRRRRLRAAARSRDRVAAELGFGGVTDNSIDAVSDRDYALETVAALAILLGHLSRLAGELVLWSTPYVGFARLDDAFSSGSSMLPNKRNPDSAELVRARAARVEGDLVTSCPLVRGLPLAYHRDLQETRRAMFDAVDSARLCLEVMSGIMAGVAFDRERMRSAAEGGHARAVILADRLVARGVPFRDAHTPHRPPGCDCRGDGRRPRRAARRRASRQRSRSSTARSSPASRRRWPPPTCTAGPRRSRVRAALGVARARASDARWRHDRLGTRRGRRRQRLRRRRAGPAARRASGGARSRRSMPANRDGVPLATELPHLAPLGLAFSDGEPERGRRRLPGAAARRVRAARGPAARARSDRGRHRRRLPAARRRCVRDLVRRPASAARSC